MKLAIVGTGIAGMTAAHLLHQDHDLTVFEAGAYIGGHTNTVEVEQQGRSYAVDTGFIVFNDWTYPNFIALLDRLGVASRPERYEFQCPLRTDWSGVQRHLVEQPIRPAAESAAAVVLSHDPRHSPLQPGLTRTPG